MCSRTDKNVATSGQINGWQRWHETRTQNRVPGQTYVFQDRHMCSNVAGTDEGART